MNCGHLLLKAFSAVALILALGVSMDTNAGLFGFGDKTMNWKEEVLLHDGQIVVAERFYNLGGYPAVESRERAAIDETVTFSLPGTNKKITWKTDFRDTEPEPNSLNLLLLDIVKGVPYIATYPAGCIAYNKWRRPNPPYIFFKYQGDEWKQISLAEFPLELNRTNVIVGRPATSLLKSFYTASQVKEENHDIREAVYKSILREALANAGGSCGEMIRTGDGGWTGIGWFKKQPSREACFEYCAREKVSPQDCPCRDLFKEGK